MYLKDNATSVLQKSGSLTQFTYLANSTLVELRFTGDEDVVSNGVTFSWGMKLPYLCTNELICGMHVYIL